MEGFRGYGGLFIVRHGRRRVWQTKITLTLVVENRPPPRLFYRIRPPSLSLQLNLPHVCLVYIRAYNMLNAGTGTPSSQLSSARYPTHIRVHGIDRHEGPRHELCWQRITQPIKHGMIWREVFSTCLTCAWLSSHA